MGDRQVSSAPVTREWRRARVRDLVNEGLLALNDGYRVTNAELGTSGTPFVRGGDIGSDGEIETNVSDHVRAEFADRIRGKLSATGDVAFITKGTVGRVGFLRESQPNVVFAPQVCYWRSLRPASLDPRFLYYLLKGADFQANLSAVKTHGSMAADYVSLSDQQSFLVTLPPSDEQRAIAHILGTLDDKIELNRRTNETLEAMARALFKSWFVDFDPVHAKKAGRKPEGMGAETAALFPDDFEDSEMGKIPRGWRCGALSIICSDSRSTVYPTEIDPETPYVGLEHVPQRKMVLEVWGTAASISSQKSRFQEADVLFGKLRPYFHKVAVAPFAGVCSTDIVVVRARAPHLFGLTLGHLSSDAFVAYTTAGSDGTRMPRTSWDRMSKYGIVVPGEDSARAHSHHVRDLVQRQVAAVAQSRTLAALRDALLPQLLSGSLRVPEAMRLVEKVI